MIEPDARDDLFKPRRVTRRYETAVLSRGTAGDLAGFEKHDLLPACRERARGP